MRKTLKIAVVCTGNINRSPVVAEYLKKYTNFEVVSGALTDNFKQRGATISAIYFAKKYDLCLTDHINSKFVPDVYDEILCMQPSHVKKLNELYLGNTPKITNLGVLIGKNKIDDPGFMSNNDPKKTVAFEDCILAAKKWIDNIKYKYNEYE
jgi:protein-tyrosine-phosphatase